MAAPYILLIEDDEDDAAVVLSAHRRGARKEPLVLCGDTAAARRCIDELGLPALTLLDIGLPGESELSYARILAADTRMVGRPIVVHSGLLDPATVRELYDVGVNAVTMKSADFGEATEAMTAILAFWLGVNLVA